MNSHILFPFSEYWLAYLGFTALIAVFLALDLGVFHREPKPVSFREATLWSVVWIILALVFNGGLYLYAVKHFSLEVGRQVGLEFLSGYVVERALSIDNIFIFAVVFSYFAIPSAYQHRVLFYGIVGAFVFRAIFVALGSVLMQYHWVVIFFGGLLILTGLKMLLPQSSNQDLSQNWVLRLMRRWLPVTDKFDRDRFFVRQGGVMVATPMFAALAFMEVTDIVFALDSVPAIFALTKEPFLVFTSNVFAILGLRAMYFMLAGAMDRFYLLKYGLSAVLIFVGLKMVWLNGLYDGKFPIGLSLGIITLLLAVPTFLSLLLPKRPELAAESDTP
ncbi:MAG: TerC family protein [Bryobacterales bacterium]|nr:TerC family protein [Bryobacterales bacterium]